MMAVIRAGDAAPDEFQTVCLEALRRLGGMPEQDEARWGTLVSVVLHWVVHRRTRPEQEAIFAQVPGTQPRQRLERSGEMIKTAADSLREEGELRGARTILRRLLESHFGPLPATVAQRIETANDLERLMEAAVQAPHLARLEDLQL
jgi:hypothetical protein